MTPDDPRLPDQVASLRQRFDHWRSTRTKPYRIPRPLWRAAVRCAGKYGVYRTCRALGLDYNCLKRRVMAATAPVPPAAFVELVTPGRYGPPECIVEVERPGGSKLRVELRGSFGIRDLADLARRFVAEEA